MTLDPELTFSAIRIVGQFGAGRAATGTGFCVTVASEAREDVWHPYVLTAHHVIDGEMLIEIEAPDRDHPGEFHPRARVPHWRQPIRGVDLALAPLPPAARRGVTALHLGWHVVPDLDLGPHVGGTLHYVGLLAPLERPMVRSGTVGAVNQKNVRHDYEGYSYACHLADCRSYTGFSGSPCFLELAFADLEPKAVPDWLPMTDGRLGRITYAHVLCGMFSEHLDAEDPIDAASRLGVGVIVRSDEICAALLSPEAKEERLRWDRS